MKHIYIKIKLTSKKNLHTHIIENKLKNLMDIHHPVKKFRHLTILSDNEKEIKLKLMTRDNYTFA